MSAYLYPELPSKKAYKDAIAKGRVITAVENTPFGYTPITDSRCSFEGPHYPKPHVYYGTAIVKDGKVIKVS